LVGLIKEKEHTQKAGHIAWSFVYFHT